MQQEQKDTTKQPHTYRLDFYRNISGLGEFLSLTETEKQEAINIASRSQLCSTEEFGRDLPMGIANSPPEAYVSRSRVPWVDIQRTGQRTTSILAHEVIEETCKSTMNEDRQKQIFDKLGIADIYQELTEEKPANQLIGALLGLRTPAHHLGIAAEVFTASQSNLLKEIINMRQDSLTGTLKLRESPSRMHDADTDSYLDEIVRLKSLGLKTSQRISSYINPTE